MDGLSSATISSDCAPFGSRTLCVTQRVRTFAVVQVMAVVAELAAATGNLVAFKRGSEYV
jgi:hypothetical protein